MARANCESKAVLASNTSVRGLQNDPGILEMNSAPSCGPENRWRGTEFYANWWDEGRDEL